MKSLVTICLKAHISTPGSQAPRGQEAAVSATQHCLAQGRHRRDIQEEQRPWGGSQVRTWAFELGRTKFQLLCLLARWS